MTAVSNHILLDRNTLALMDQVERDACKQSLFEFVQSFWSVIIQEAPVYNWHIPYLCEELEKLTYYIINRKEKPYDLIINIPPGTSKSTIVTIMWPAWIWTQDPTIRIISNSYSLGLSLEHALKSKDIISSPKYRRLFPEVKIRRDKGLKSNYENTRNGERITTSTGGTIMGRHAHLVINDDPTNPTQAASDAERVEANNHTKTLSSRKVDKRNTPTVTIMQRLHEDDVTGFILKKKADTVRHICLPATLSKDVRPLEIVHQYKDGLLDPVRLSRTVLAEAKVDLGSQAYAGQYDQQPVADGGNIVKREWFKTISRDMFEGLRRGEPVVFFADTAYTEKAGENDPSGLMATCKIGGDLYVLHAQKVYMEFPELLKFVPTYAQTHGYTHSSSIRIEPKASGKSVVQTLQRGTSLNVVETPAPKDDKKTRLTAASPKIEAGRVILVAGAWNEEVITEVTGFPAQPHDEHVDNLCYAIDYHFNQSNDTDTLQNLMNFVL